MPWRHFEAPAGVLIPDKGALQRLLLEMYPEKGLDDVLTLLDLVNVGPRSIPSRIYSDLVYVIGRCPTSETYWIRARGNEQALAMEQSLSDQFGFIMGTEVGLRFDPDGPNQPLQMEFSVIFQKAAAMLPGAQLSCLLGLPELIRKAIFDQVLSCYMLKDSLVETKRYAVDMLLTGKLCMLREGDLTMEISGSQFTVLAKGGKWVGITLMLAEDPSGIVFNQLDVLTFSQRFAQLAA